jgi:hypothetical protein
MLKLVADHHVDAIRSVPAGFCKARTSVVELAQVANPGLLSDTCA